MLLIAFLLGLSGSAHCVLMCGPVVSVFMNSSDWRRLVLYHVGRLITYMWLGLIFGMIGHSLILGGFQQIISIITGSILLLIVLFGIKIPVLNRINQSITGFITRLYRLKILPKNKFGKSVVLGMFNGLMPCGLLYAAIIGAAMMPTISYSFLFMFLFWIGTSPFLVLVTIIKSRFNQRFKGVKIAGQLIMALLGTLLILRGAALDIPYISPVLDYVMQTGAAQYTTDMATCH